MNPVKITLLTTGQPSTNPRLVKEADALTEAGYEVVVIYCFWAAWAEEETDKALLASRSWKAIQVGGSPHKNRWLWYYTRLRKKLAKRPEKAICRAFDELRAKAIQTPGDLYIAHNLGACPPPLWPPKKQANPSGSTPKIFHREEEDPELPQSRLKSLIEKQYIPKAAYTSAASPLIAEAYRLLFPEKNWQPILNVFSTSPAVQFQERRRKPHPHDMVFPNRGFEPRNSGCHICDE